MRQELVKQINAKIDEEVAKFIRELPQHVAKMLSGAMLSAFGLRNGFGSSFGAYEVDYSNGRESLIGKCVKDKAGEEAEKFVTEIASKAIGQFRSDRDVVVAILKEATVQYKQKLRDNLLKLAVAKACEDAQMLLNAMSSTFDEVSGDLGDIANPKCGSESETREALLEQLAQDFISREEIVRGVTRLDDSELNSGDLVGVLEVPSGSSTADSHHDMISREEIVRR